MRTASLLAVLALASGCGDRSARLANSAGAGPLGDRSVAAQVRVSSANGARSEGEASRAAKSGADPDPGALPGLPRPSRPSGVEQDGAVVATASIGALERPAALRHLFEALSRLDQGQSHEDVRVVQFGDSHTAADYETGPLRRALQARFGDGGRGFVALGNPWKKYVQEGLRNGNTPDWAPDRGKLARGKFAGDGMYGLCGASLKASHAGARAWGDYSCKASRIEVAYLTDPRGGSIDVFIDGSRAGRISTRARTTESGFFGFDVADAPHRVEVQAVGDGEVRIFGAILDRAQVGVTLDALGINGARVSNALTWSEPHLAEQLRHRAPDLVVLAYGTNEAGDDTSPEAYERQLVDMLGRVARASPSASCMLLGPPDRAVKSRGESGREQWTTLPKLLDVIATQQRVAAAAGCAFYNQLEAMGGPGSIATWAEEAQPRAGRDRVHLTRDGYAQLAAALSSDLLRAYAAWQSDVGLASPDRARLPTEPPRPAQPAVAPANAPAALPTPEPHPVLRGSHEPVARTR